VQQLVKAPRLSSGSNIPSAVADRTSRERKFDEAKNNILNSQAQWCLISNSQ